MKYIIPILAGLVMGAALGASLRLSHKTGYVEAMNKCEPVLTECTQWLTTAVDIIESGQYCTTVCAAAFERMGC